MARMLPYWYDAIVPDLAAGRTVLVAAHGNSLRALVKHLDGISDDDIAELNLPTGVPIRYELGDDFLPVDGACPSRSATWATSRRPGPRPKPWPARPADPHRRPGDRLLRCACSRRPGPPPRLPRPAPGRGPRVGTRPAGLAARAGARPRLPAARPHLGGGPHPPAGDLEPGRPLRPDDPAPPAGGRPASSSSTGPTPPRWCRAPTCRSTGCRMRRAFTGDRRVRDAGSATGSSRQRRRPPTHRRRPSTSSGPLRTQDLAQPAPCGRGPSGGWTDDADRGAPARGAHRTRGEVLVARRDGRHPLVGPGRAAACRADVSDRGAHRGTRSCARGRGRPCGPSAWPPRPRSTATSPATATRTCPTGCPSWWPTGCSCRRPSTGCKGRVVPPRRRRRHARRARRRPGSPCCRRSTT